MKRKPPILRSGRAVPEKDRELFLRALAEDDPRAARKARLDAEARKPQPHPGPRLRRRLDRGDLKPTAKIDLHGLDREHAASRLEAFIAQRPAGEIALVIHGKGAGILARRVQEVLHASSRVAEHLPAPSGLGGDGARVIRIRNR